MGFYLRKSLKLGPIRLNFSKSGVGVSAGVTGARVGVNAKGKKYVHVGRGGIYYRQTLADDPQTESDEANSSGKGIGWVTILVIAIALLIIYRLMAG